MHRIHVNMTHVLTHGLTRHPRVKFVLNHMMFSLRSTINLWSNVTQVNGGSTFALIRSTLDFCLGGQ